MERKRITQKRRFENSLKFLEMYYDEKAINQKSIFELVSGVRELIFALKVEKEIRIKLEELQRNRQDYQKELKNAFQCQELIRHHKLDLIDQIIKAK